MTRAFLKIGMVGVAVVALLLVAPRAWASHHFWKIVEVFSNDDGSIQFIELHCEQNGQNFLQNTTLSSSTHTVTFPFNLPSSQTLNRRLLLATPGFSALAAITPDLALPELFFDPHSQTPIVLNYAEGFDTWTITPGMIPTDCVYSLHRVPPSTVFILSSSPVNFAGQHGFPITCPEIVCPGNLNDDFTVNVDDLLVLLGSWGACDNPENCPADLAPEKGDGAVNVDDLLVLLGAWGSCQ